MTSTPQKGVCASDLAAELEGLSRDAAQTSVAILEGLSTVREHANRVVSLADEFSNASGDGTGRDGDIEYRAGLVQVFSDVATRTESCAGTVGSLDSNEILTMLRSSDTALLDMRMIAVLLKIDAAGQADHEDTISGFAESYHALVERVGQVIKEACATGKAVDDAIGRALVSISLASDLSDKQSRQIAQRLQASDALMADRDTALRQINQSTRALSDELTAEIATLLQCVQFADAFSQRVGNAQKILAAAGDHGSEGTAAATWLVVRQLSALTEDAAKIRSQISDGLDRVYGASFRGQQALTGKSDFLAASSKWLDEESRVIETVGSACDSLNTALSESFDRLQVALDTGKTLSSQISVFENLAHSLGIEAVNGAISSARNARNNRAHSAATVLAGEVKTLATACADLLSRCGVALQRTETALESIDGTEIKRSLDAVLELKSLAMEAWKRQDETKDRLAALQTSIAETLGQLVDACKSARDVSRALADLDASLRRWAERFGTGAQNQPDPSSLAWAWAIYTTDEERNLHASLLGRPADADETAVDVEDDDLAGFVI